MVSERVHLERGGSFVELEQQGELLERAWGAVGGASKLRLENLGDAAAAALALEAEVRRLERKGYRVGLHHPELEDAILAHPHDPSPRLVFADWLLERRDPRGELITRTASGVPVADLLARHPFHLAPSWTSALELEWHLGFVRAVTVRNMFDASFLYRVFRHPSFMVLEELRVLDTRHAYIGLVRQVLSRRPQSLRRVEARGILALEPLTREIPGFEI